jgi:hypothetical protein
LFHKFPLNFEAILTKIAKFKENLLSQKAQQI